MIRVYVHGSGHLAKITRDFMRHREWPASPPATAEILWACEDVESHSQGQAIDGIHQLVRMNPKALCLISSQLPVGTIRMLEQDHPEVSFACCPEDFRASDDYMAYHQQTRFVVGMRTLKHWTLLRELFEFAPHRVQFVTIESAEMVKHAINAYLGLCIAFINEIRDISEVAGANIHEVEHGLLTEARVSPLAPLHAGDPFSGGHIDRDLKYLRDIHRTPLIEAIYESNHSRRR